MTNDRLAEIEARANAATAGPWQAVDTDDNYCMCASAVTTGPIYGALGEPFDEHGKVVAITLLQTPRLADVADMKWDENAAFIAHARSDIPYLIAELRAMDAENERLLMEIERLRKEPPCTPT